MALSSEAKLSLDSSIHVHKELQVRLYVQMQTLQDGLFILKQVPLGVLCPPLRRDLPFQTKLPLLSLGQKLFWASKEP